MCHYQTVRLHGVGGLLLRPAPAADRGCFSAAAPKTGPAPRVLDHPWSRFRLSAHWLPRDFSEQQ